MVFVIISAPSCRVAHAKTAREFQIILELVSWSLIQNVLWEVLSFHLGLKFSTFRLKVFCNKVFLDSAVEIQIKVNDLNSSGRKLVRHCDGAEFHKILKDTYSKKNYTALLQTLTKLG